MNSDAFDIVNTSLTSVLVLRLKLHCGKAIELWSFDSGLQ